MPVIFQPELRRALEQLGRGWLVFKALPDSESMEHAIEAVVEASEHMARHNVGALIVFERQTGLQEYIETGVELNADISSELLSTIFDHHTILHDGAVIISDSRLASAACVLPLTSAILADRELGLRHRAALGVTEESDAICVVISEERGAISITHSGRIIRDLDKKRLNSILHAFPAAQGTILRPRYLPTPLQGQSKIEGSRQMSQEIRQNLSLLSLSVFSLSSSGRLRSNRRIRPSSAPIPTRHHRHASPSTR